MKATAKNLRTGCLFAAAFFLFNPNITILDLLPDFIGYLLILRAISGLRDIIPHFEEAALSLRRLLYFTAVRLPAYFMMLGQTAVNGEFRTLVALCFGIVELVLLYPFLREFFAGMDYIGERFGATSTIDRRATRARRAAYVALSAKPVLAFLPEVSLLFSASSSDFVTANGLYPADFRPHFVVIAAMIALGLGIYFLSAFLPFCRSLARDEALEPLLHRVREDKDNPLRGEARIRLVRRAFLFFTLGSAFMLTLVFDGINYMPNAIAYLFYLLFALTLRAIDRPRSMAVAFLSAVMIPLSLFPYLMKAEFIRNYGYHLLGRSRAADELYGRLCLFTVIEAVMAAVLLLLILFLILSLIRRETGYRYDNVNNYSSHLPLHRALAGRVRLVLSVGFLGLAMEVADIFLRRITQTLEYGIEGGVTEVIVLPTYGWLQWVVFAVFLLYTALSSSTGEVLCTEVKRRYELD